MALFISGAFHANSQNKEYKYPFLNPGLPLEQRVDDLISRMTLQEKVQQMEHEAPAIERLNVVAYNWWNEALHGVARTDEKVTVFPQAIGMAASFDDEALRRVGDIASTEGRAIFNEDMKNGTTGTIYRGLTFWTPNVNIFRDPRWGRGQETYGEDPFLSSRMGAAMVRGLQGDDPYYLKAVACAKHYAVHSGPEHNRHSFNAEASDFDLWDTYLPAFKILVKDAKVEGVMCAYNRFRGEECCGNGPLMTEILREQWGFKGYSVSDCWAVSDFYKFHKTHPDAVTSISTSLEAGTDLECGNLYRQLTSAVDKGLVNEHQVNRSIKRLFEIRMRLGMFDDQNPYAKIGKDAIETDENKKEAYEMAQKSMVLLKNEKNILPLDKKKYKRIAVVGPNADNEEVLLANYFGRPTHIVSALEGIKNKFSDSEIIYAKGVDHVKDIEGVEYADVLDQVSKADVIIFVGGISADYEGEAGDAGAGGYAGFASGDRVSLDLPPVQTNLMKTLKKLNKLLVYVNMSGSAITMDWQVKNADAIIQAWYGGQAGGTAIADVIAGDYNPAGRMPLTTYKSEDDLPGFEDYSMENRTYRYFHGDVQYPFGYGLSYTEFRFDNIELSKEIATDKPVKVKAIVTNVGKKDGDEVVQLYVKHHKKTYREANCSLKGFQRIHLKKGESKVVEFELRPEDLATVDEHGMSAVSEGDVEISIGGGQPKYASHISKISTIKGDRYQIM